MSETADVMAWIERLRQAVDAHDLDRLVACFAPDYINVTPLHPARSFSGRDQVRANWQRIFAGVPDITAAILRTAVDGTTLWSEWEMRGTRNDGAAHLMRGVIVFEVVEDVATTARFYLEPVDTSDDNVDAAVGRLVEPGATR